MKKAFLSLLFIAIVMITWAQGSQETSNHLTFKGVPIDGTLDNFVLKMKQSGFTHTTTKDGVAILRGDFASYKSCMVGVSTLTTKDLVSKIIVLFPELDDWSSLSGNYFDLKEMLTSKYGKPSDCIENFNRTPRDDNDRMYEVKLDRCKYLTSYETAKGTIQLAIAHNDVSRCFVKLAYFDKINGETVKKQALDDL